MTAQAPYPAYIHAYPRPDKRSAIGQNMPYDAEFTRDERQLNQHENPYDAMSDDNSHSSDTVNSKGIFLPLTQPTFPRRTQNRDELLALIRDSGQNELIDEDTRDMLEGVMDIADQRVRDIMIPRSQMITLKRTRRWTSASM